MTALIKQETFYFSPDILDYFLSIQDNYFFHVREFVRFAESAGGKNIFQVIKDFYTYLNNGQYAAATVRVKRAALKNRLRRVIATFDDKTRNSFEFELKQLDSDPSTKAPGLSSQAVNHDRVISEPEYLILLKKARSDRQRCFIQFLYTTGARVSELTGILFSDCTSGEKHVVIKLRGKGNARMKYKEREVFISLVLFNRIKDIFKGAKYLFETSAGRSYNRSYVSNQLGKLTQKILGRHISAHGFRHSFATVQVQRTGRVKAVSSYLGHADVGLTMRLYCHDVFSAADVLGAEFIDTKE